MSDPRPNNTPWLAPYLMVKSAEAALDFYERAFGFARGNAVNHDGKVQHAEMYYRGQIVVMFAPEGAFGSTAKAPATLGVEASQTFYVYVDDVDSLFARANAADAKALMPPADMFWGDRYCMLQDPDGYRWGFARHLAKPAVA